MESLPNSFVFDFDINKSIIINPYFVQGNVNSSVLEPHLTNNGAVVDITGETIQFRFLKADNTIVYQDVTTGVSILFATDGILQCILEPNTLAAAGIVKCELHRSINNIQLATNVFYFTISSGIGDNPTISQSYISAIETEVASITAKENTRITSEGSRVIAETARTVAESARVVAETSRVNDNTSYKVLEVYDSVDTYVPLNSVTYGGSTYQNILACTGVLPTNTTNWILTALAGSGSNITPSLTNGNIKVNNVEQTVYSDTTIQSSLAQNAHQNVCYVETNGNDTNAQVNQISKQFATINKALDALPLNGGIIKIGIGTFAPIDYTKFKDNITLEGSGRPEVNSTGSGLIYGTIIQGSLYRLNKNGTKIFNLGVDSGLDVCNALYSGVAQEGLQLTCTSAAHEVVPPNTGLEINRVTTLCKDAYSAVHSCLIEGVDGAVINDVKTYYGVHGFVLKGINCQIGTISAYGSNGEGVIIRDSPYAHCNNNNIERIIISSWNQQAGGLMLDGDENGMSVNNINIGTVILLNTKYGIQLFSSATSYVQQNIIENIIMQGISDNSLEFIGQCTRNKIGNFYSMACKSNGIVFSTTSTLNDIADARIVSDGTPSIGVSLNGNNNRLDKIVLEGFTTPWNFAGTGLSNVYNSLIASYTGDPTLVLINDSDLIPKLPTFLNSFHNVDTNINSQCRYFKIGKMVYIEGYVFGGAALKAIFTLPSGYIPVYNKHFIIGCDGTGGTGAGQVCVLNSGDVLFVGGSGNAYCLDGISFRLG